MTSKPSTPSTVAGRKFHAPDAGDLIVSPEHRRVYALAIESEVAAIGSAQRERHHAELMAAISDLEAKADVALQARADSDRTVAVLREALEQIWAYAIENWPGDTFDLKDQFAVLANPSEAAREYEARIRADERVRWEEEHQRVRTDHIAIAVKPWRELVETIYGDCREVTEHQHGDAYRTLLYIETRIEATQPTPAPTSREEGCTECRAPSGYHAYGCDAGAREWESARPTPPESATPEKMP